MLENPSDLPASDALAAPIKRYAPPNQRNRGGLGLNRRKSGDRSERVSSLHSNDGDMNLGAAFRSVPSTDHTDAGSSKSVNERFHSQFIALSGCCRSDASQLLHERWKAAIHCYNDPSIDLSERPVMYTGSAASAWGNFRLPHQLMSCPQMDFLEELKHAIHKCNANMGN